MLSSGKLACNSSNSESEFDSISHDEETEETNEVLNEEADSLAQENGLTLPDEPMLTRVTQPGRGQEQYDTESDSFKPTPARRYPLRERKPKDYTDYITGPK